MFNKIRKHNFIWSFVLCLTLTSCDGDNVNKTITLNENQQPNTQQKIGNLLPFKVCNVIINDNFKNDFSLLDIDIKVSGGHSNDWVATGIAVSKQLGSLGITTDVNLKIFRSDLGELDNKQTARGFKWLVNVFYGVDPNHSMNTMDNSSQWIIGYATDSSVATIRDIEIHKYYYKLMNDNNNPSIDDRVVKKVKKKYNLSGDFKLPFMNIISNTKSPDEYYINSNGNYNELINLSSLINELSVNKWKKNINCSTND